MFIGGGGFEGVQIPAPQKILIIHPAVLDSKKPGLLRVKVIIYQMPWQKCMSFVKCSDFKVKEVICFTLRHQRDKGFNYIVQQSKSRKQTFLWVLCIRESKLKENFKPKTKLIKDEIQFLTNQGKIFSAFKCSLIF